MKDIVKKTKSSVLALLTIGVIATALLTPSPTIAVEPQGCEVTYKAKCAVCHGVDGSGNTTMGKKLAVKDLRSPEVQKMSDDQLFQLIAVGKGKMPGYEKPLGKDMVKEMVAYTRALAKKK
jgi:mono/diheme cytochrome c family protein